MSWADYIMFGEALPASATAFLNSDGTRTVFRGTGFTYDAAGLPTGGTITHVDHVLPGTGVLERITSVTPGASIGSAADFTRHISGSLALRAEIGWYEAIGPIEAGSLLELTDTLVRITNSDGTFTHVVGHELTRGGPVTSIRHVSASGQELQSVAVSFGGLGVSAGALSDASLSEMVYLNFLVSSGGARITQFTPADPSDPIDWGYQVSGYGADVIVGLPDSVTGDVPRGWTIATRRTASRWISPPARGAATLARAR